MSGKKQTTTIIILTAILFVIASITIGVGISRGWFNGEKAVIDSEYFGSSELRTINTDQYNQLINDKKSFLIITYQPGCTADLLSFIKKFSEEKNISFNYYVWSALRESPLHNNIKHPPSVAVISKGEVVAYLKADSNDDTEKYNNYDTFKAWLEEKVAF